MVMAPPPTRDSAVSPNFHGFPGFLHRHFPPQSPPPHPLNSSLHSQQQPLPWDCSTVPNSSSQLLRLPGDLHGCDKNCLILIPFRLPQISCFTLSLKCFSLTQDSCPDVGPGPLLQFPHPLRAGPVLPTLLFFPLVPSSYRVLHGSIYSFQLVRYFCLLSAGVLPALLCLKVYS